jgi:ABC-type nitrate/sulfonate/bicarbonate transport system substrate-binding protein
MRIMKLFAIVVALCAATVANAQSLEKKKITLAVGGKSLLYYLPLTIAERKGYFKAEGLDVEIVDFPGGAKALQAMVGGEYLSSAAGVGYLILQAEAVFDINTVFAGILVLTAFALALDGLVTVAEKRLLVWRPAQGETER